MRRLPFGVRLAALALACADLAACVPETDTWLSDPATAKADAQLAGVFFGSDTGKDKHMIVVEAAPDGAGKTGGVVNLVWAQLKPDNAEKTVVWAAYRAWPARLPGGARVLNLERTGAGPFMARLAPHRFFVLYTVGADGAVTVRMPRNRPWSRAVQTGAVAGRVVKGRYFDQITLTASRETLAKYIAANAGALFEATGQTWRRIR